MSDSFSESIVATMLEAARPVRLRRQGEASLRPGAPDPRARLRRRAHPCKIDP